MILLDSFEQLNKDKGTVVTIGKFDGIHLGHRALIQKAVSIAKESGYVSLVYIMDIPLSRRILTREQTFAILESLGVDYVLIQPLNADYMKADRGEFLEKHLIGDLNMRVMVTGTDFRFGYERKGDIAYLDMMKDRFGYDFYSLSKKELNGQIVSSTMIRDLLQEGMIPEANEALGSVYTIEGEVIHGRQIGRTISFPTINVLPPREQILPKFGVYVVEVSVKGEVHKGIANIGVKPTIDDVNMPLLEVHLVNFSGDLYGEYAVVRFNRFVRAERKFGSIQELQEQIASDLSQV